MLVLLCAGAAVGAGAVNHQDDDTKVLNNARGRIRIDRETREVARVEFELIDRVRLLAALGVFGMVSDTANRRLRELALRQALGARRSRVLAELLRSTLACVLAGLCAGALLAVTASRALSLELFEIGPAAPWIVVAVCSLILGVSVVACIGPAARVGRLDVGAMLRE